MPVASPEQQAHDFVRENAKELWVTAREWVRLIPSERRTPNQREAALASLAHAAHLRFNLDARTPSDLFMEETAAEMAPLYRSGNHSGAILYINERLRLAEDRFAGQDRTAVDDRLLSSRASLSYMWAVRGSLRDAGMGDEKRGLVLLSGARDFMQSDMVLGYRRKDQAVQALACLVMGGLQDLARAVADKGLLARVIPPEISQATRGLIVEPLPPIVRMINRQTIQALSS